MPVAAASKRISPAFALAFLLALAGARAARAHDVADKIAGEMPSALEGEKNSAEEFETKHIFGFTEGGDVGEAGDKEVEFTTSDSIGKQGGGRYNAIQQKAVYEAATTDRFGYEVGPLGVSQQIANVPGLFNLSQTSFSGLAFEPKYIFLKRGIDAPFGLAVSVAPEWDRIDPVVGARSSNVLAETRIYLDWEFIEKKFYGAVNLIYSPEVDNEQGSGISHYALAGATAALTWRFAPHFAAGVEAEYYEVYNSLGFTQRVGSAAYLGPTLWAQLTPRSFLSLAWSPQIGGNAPGSLSPNYAAYNQSDIARQRVHLVYGVSF